MKTDNKEISTTLKSVLPDEITGIIKSEYAQSVRDYFREDSPTKRVLDAEIEGLTQIALDKILRSLRFSEQGLKDLNQHYNPGTDNLQAILLGLATSSSDTAIEATIKLLLS